MTQIRVNALLELVTSAVAGQGFDHDVARALALEFVSAEVAGTKTHGVGKLISMNLGDAHASPTSDVHGAVVVANGNGINGFVFLRQLASQVGDLAEQYGIGAAFARNFSRYSSLYPYPELLAERGLVGILMNEAGPPAVAPFGSLDPVTGTNPICFSFPTDAGPRTLDLATSEVVWGAIRQSALEGKPLPTGAFLDVDGGEPASPDDVNAVRAFGGAKGFALNFAIEILAGALVGGKMGNEVQSEFDAGALLVALNPALVDAQQFGAAVERLIQEVRGARPFAGGPTVHAPGDSARGVSALKDAEQNDVDVPQLTLDMLGRMAKGESLQELASNPLFN